MTLSPATRVDLTADGPIGDDRPGHRALSGPRSSGWRTVGIVQLVVTIGFIAVNIDLDTLGVPDVLPLSSLTWLTIVAAWAIPVSLFVDEVSLRPRLDGATSWLLVLFVLAACSVFWSIHPGRSLVGATVSLAVLLGAYAATHALGWNAICRLLSGSLLIFTASGLIRDIVSERLIASVPAVLAAEQRFAGLTFSPTDLGRIAAFGVVVSALAAASTTGRGRVVHSAAMVVALLALVSSGTRLVILGLLIVGAVAAIRRRTAASVLVAAVTTTALVAAMVFPSSLAESVARPGEPAAHVLEFAGRTPVWSAALDLVANRPLLGHGWMANEVVFREAFIADIIDFEAFTGHNMVVGVLVDLGVVGATLLLLALIALWRSSRTTAGARLLLLLVLLTGTIEATLSRPSLTIAVLGMIAAAATAAPSSGADHG
ncbi:MAG TPA: O-antigen ligase family protein [Ilumatobacteraceae bacterium]|nr:O-antigen ligase family protein [Ilumatobacteraceae bacterium]